MLDLVRRVKRLCHCQPGTCLLDRGCVREGQIAGWTHLGSWWRLFSLECHSLPHASGHLSTTFLSKFLSDHRESCTLHFLQKEHRLCAFPPHLHASASATCQHSWCWWNQSRPFYLRLISLPHLRTEFSSDLWPFWSFDVGRVPLGNYFNLLSSLWVNRNWQSFMTHLWLPTSLYSQRLRSARCLGIQLSIVSWIHLVFFVGQACPFGLIVLRSTWLPFLSLMSCILPKT